MLEIIKTMRPRGTINNKTIQDDLTNFKGDVYKHYQKLQERLDNLYLYFILFVVGQILIIIFKH